MNCCYLWNFINFCIKIYALKKKSVKETEAINLNQKKIIVTDNFIFIFCVKYKFLNV